MALDKAITSGKEKRKPYRGSKSFDRTCRNHGGCTRCEHGRLHNNKRRTPLQDADTLQQLAAGSTKRSGEGVIDREVTKSDDTEVFEAEVKNSQKTEVFELEVKKEGEG